MEWKMESEKFKSWEQEPVDLNIAYTDTCVPPEVMEAFNAITSTGSTGHVDHGNRPEKAELLTPRHPNQLLGYSRGALMADHSDRRGLLQSQITNFTALSRSSRHPKLSLKFKCLQRESFSAIGTGVYYMPRQLSASKCYVNASTVEGLSLLADVSCEVERTHLQRSCNITRKLSDSYKERVNQMPLRKKVAFVQKNFNRPNFNEHRTDQHSRKITDTFKVVRKLRTPRRTLLRCPTKLQKNINLSKCDEILSRLWESSASFLNTAHFRDRLPMTDTQAITSACEDMLGEDKFPDIKSMSCNIDSVLPAVQSVTTIEKVSKSSCQISDTMKKPFKGFTRSEWFCNKVLEFIGAMTVPEKLIRQTLGNNPDTSKALRLLLTEHKVMRFGSGGRGRAYEYVATKKGLLHIQCGANQAVSEVVELTHESVSSCNPTSGVTVVSDAPKSETQCLPARDTNCPEASVSNTNHESRSCSVTPHCSLQWPLTQTLNCVLSSQSLDVPSSGITEC